jgi:hypothetical protein
MELPAQALRHSAKSAASFANCEETGRTSAAGSRSTWMESRRRLPMVRWHGMDSRVTRCALYVYVKAEPQPQ